MTHQLWKSIVTDALPRLHGELDQIYRHTEEKDVMPAWQTFLMAQRSMDRIRLALVGEPVAIPDAQPAPPSATDAESQRLIDIANLRMYARLTRENGRSDKCFHWNVFERTLNAIADRLAAQPAPGCQLEAIRLSEQQWQALAQIIKAASGWNEISQLMDQSWAMLQSQQQLVTAYLGDVKWIELPLPAAPPEPAPEPKK